ncbi:DNA glycosylase [Phascolomyces articulosus]|uniref:Adenine DNA glycosylase n=1 Tax=Phascolomyces articulosus TaxID=60185 RepID=A0AAD5PBR8_9FUNG|nr:DNA glycosylase [Phascolomyces articulosus]
MTINEIDIEDCVQSGCLAHGNIYHKISSHDQQLIQDRLLDYYDREKRTNMPWRKPTRTDLDSKALGQRAYEVATVIGYYDRWMEAFPTIQDLAIADIEKVNELWAGLGYYSRARRLWEGAQKVCNEFNGLLPNNADDLQKHIPGVGRYTAGAVASIVFNQVTPVVDGNVIRVIARLRAISADTKKSNTVELFWDIAAQLTSKERPGDFNQAMMELGARVCTPQNPECDTCPVQKNCHAYAQKQIHARLKTEKFWEQKKRKRPIDHECTYCPEIKSNLDQDEDYVVTRYPAKPEKKKPRDEECAVYIVQSNSKFLISKRPDTGLLAGLWEFPSLELESLETTYEGRSAKASDFLHERYDLDITKNKVTKRQDLGNVVHLFSHIRKVYHVEWVQVSEESVVEDEDQVKWVTMDELKKSPIPTGLKKALALLEKSQNQKKSTTKSNPSANKKQKVIKNTADIKSFFVSTNKS